MIRYDKKFNNEINKAVRNYNAKIKRLNEKGITTPLKIRVRDIKKNANSRKELKKTIADLKYFTQRGSENIKEGYNISNYDYRILSRLQKEALRNIERQMKPFEDIIPTIFGEPQVLTSAQMKEDRYINLQAKRDIIKRTNLKLLSPSDVEKMIKKFEKNKYVIDYDEWKKRYIDIFNKTLNTYNLHPDKVKEVIKKLDELTPQQFDNLIRFEKSFRAILDYYKMMTDLEDIWNIESEVNTIFDSIHSSIDDIIRFYKEPH